MSVAKPSSQASSNDELDELTEDSIVAATSAPHTPKPRVNVKVEEPSVVLADDLAADEEAEKARLTRPAGLKPYRETQDPTLVVRRADTEKYLKSRKAGWTTWAIWAGAGALAFGFGGMLASMGSDEEASGKGVGVTIETNTKGPSAPADPAPPSAPTAEEPQVEQVAKVEDPVAEVSVDDDDDDAGLALNPHELPVATPKMRPTPPAVRPPVGRPTAPIKPKPKPRPRPRPSETDIPSGI